MAFARQVMVCLVAASLVAGERGWSAPPPELTPQADQPDEIVIVGRPPRCHPRPGDPQDQVDLRAAAAGHRQTIRLDPATGGYALVADDYPETGPDVWQRAGMHIDRFVFRTPTNGDPICIGVRARSMVGEAQLRRAFAARPYWGKYMLLSVYLATRDAGPVAMWVAAGAKDPRPRTEADITRDIVAGGPKPIAITGNQSWRQVNLLIGPIPCMAAQVSYGVQIAGGGNVWLAKPHFVEVPEDKLSPSMKARLHGPAMLRSDPICAHYLQGKRLFVRRDADMVGLASDADLYPGLALYRQTESGQYEPIPYNEGFAPGVVEF